MLPHQHYDSSPLGPLVAQSMQPNDDRDLAGQKEDEVDASSRPRLTTEQTNVLEEHFQRESKPITEVKKQLAAQVGLPLDKNWYQNRRAKAKHLKKQEILEVMHFHHNPVGIWTYGDMISPGFPPSAYRSSELLSTPIQPSMEQADFTSYDSTPETTSPYELHTQRSYPGWVGMRENAGAPQLAHPFSNNEAGVQAVPSNDTRLQQFIVNNVQSNGADGPVPTFSEWGGSKAPSAAWDPAAQCDNPFDDNPLLLQQSGIPSFMQDIDVQDQGVQQLTADIDPYTLYRNPMAVHNSQPIPQPIALTQQQIKRQSPDGSPFVSMQDQPVQTPTHQQIFQHSPDGSPFASLPQHHPQESVHSRRGSDSSDLASNFDTIHLQKVSSQQSNGKGVFKTPSIPNLNLAARRKKQRPAALGTVAMRSQSCAGPQNASPVTKCMTLSPSHSVRRIRSTGNSLNVMSGRIQKSGAGQRSPLNFQTFHEAGAFDSVDAFTAQSTDTSQTSTGVNAGPLTPHTPSKLESQSQSLGKPSIHFESSPTILQSQNFSHNTQDGSSQVTSPPDTPFTDMQLYPQYQS
ncbi:MAG: hypothetical protein Q9187_008637, partial [Circinaria calcarea]